MRNAMDVSTLSLIHQRYGGTYGQRKELEKTRASLRESLESLQGKQVNDLAAEGMLEGIQKICGAAGSAARPEMGG